jgi:alpha/beta superfamily hydrolase
MIHEEKSIFSNQQGEELVGLLSMPNDHAPIVIIAHGLGSSKDGSVYLGLQHGLNAHGIGSFRFDFFGHGESSGKFQDITLSEGVANVEAAFQYLHGRFKHVPICLLWFQFWRGRAHTMPQQLSVLPVLL